MVDNLPPNLTLRKNGVYYVIKVTNGRRKKISTGKRDFKSALRRYHEIMKDLNDGQSGWTRNVVPSFEDYWKDYRSAYTIRKTPLPGHTDKYRDDQLVQRALKNFGRTALDQFTKSFCQRFVNKLRTVQVIIKNGQGEVVREGTLSESAITREVSFLKAVFQQAVEDGIIEKNPWKRIELEDYAVKDRVITPAEQAKLEDVLSPRYRRWFLFMLGTGLRLEEARGIREAGDVDFPNRWIRVTRKTRGLDKKVQKVPLIDDYILEILQEQLTEDAQLWHQNQQRFREVLSDAAKRANVGHVSPHTLRHTFATRYLQGGGDIYVLSKILGHSSVAITEKIYAHLLSEDLLLRSRGVSLGLRTGVGASVLAFPRASAAR